MRSIGTVTGEIWLDLIEMAVWMMVKPLEVAWVFGWTLVETCSLRSGQGLPNS